MHVAHPSCLHTTKVCHSILLGLPRRECCVCLHYHGWSPCFCFIVWSPTFWELGKCDRSRGLAPFLGCSILALLNSCMLPHFAKSSHGSLWQFGGCPSLFLLLLRRKWSGVCYGVSGTLLAMDASHVARPPLLCQWRLLHIFHARSSHLSMESEARCGHHCRASVVDCRCGGAIVGPCYTSATHASASINHFLTSLHVDRRHAVCLCHSPFHLFGDGGHPCHWWYRFL
mmetsp:Transcript_25664/g.77971  ORF Transcript_25664/g.77971 Transcript_25664/m.77971 type:complete len:228 (+) Transcript_25664:794-1477(+)